MTKEHIIISKSLNATELNTSRALRGQNTFALTVMTPTALAEKALIHSGRLSDARRVRAEEQMMMFAELLKNGAPSYFRQASSLEDAEHMVCTVNELRMRFVGDERGDLPSSLLRNGEFPEKNKALARQCARYMDQLADQMDDVSLIRRAVELASPMDHEIWIPEGTLLSPLERALVERVSGGHFREVTMQEIYGLDGREEELRVASFCEAWGPMNEVDDTLREIYVGKLPLDRCTVAVTNQAYSQLIFEKAEVLHIPVTFGYGIPIANTRPKELLDLWTRWDGPGFRGTDALTELVLSSSFDMAQLKQTLEENGASADLPSVMNTIRTAGRLRIGGCSADDQRRNDEVIAAWESVPGEKETTACALRCIAKELALPCAAFMQKYARLRKDERGGALDRAALKKIHGILDLENRFPGTATVKELIDRVSGSMVCAQNAQPGTLFVTTLEGAMSAMREHLFVLGLDADRFPGNPAENPLMLDSDWEGMPEPETAPQSGTVLKQKVEAFYSLLRLAAAMGAKTHLSWSGYDPVALKRSNPSSVIYELKERFPEVETRKVGYFNTVMTDADAVGNAFLYGTAALPGPAPDESSGPEDAPDTETVDLLERRWSPTAIDTWFDCRQRFLYQYVWKLDATGPEDPMEVISAQDYGTLAHVLMQRLADEKPDRATFLRLAEEAFDDQMKLRSPMDPGAVRRKKENFLDMMGKAYDQDPHREVQSTEQKLEGDGCGLLLTGRADRIELLEDGTAVVVDYKTGGKVKHIDNDAATCRQGLLYAYLMKDLKVSLCEFRYLRCGRTVTCPVDAVQLQALERDLQLFRESLQNLGFARSAGNGGEPVGCDKCPYKALCIATAKKEMSANE